MRDGRVAGAFVGCPQGCTNAAAFLPDTNVYQTAPKTLPKASLIK
jgi:hypothetical protein